jgi:nucleotide-binding universal stress UspA family protein
VPLDGSPLAERALPSALALSDKAHGQVVLLRVATAERMFTPEPPALVGYGLLWPDQSLRESRRESETYLQATLKSKTLSPRSGRALVAEGDVATAIVDTAASEHVDLIVISSHGYSGVTRWMLGSVAERVLHAAPCPVLVTRSTSIQRVLIPLDGSDLSERALAPGLQLAAALEAEVTLLRCVPRLDSQELAHLDGIERGLGLRMIEEVRATALAYLQHLADTRAPSGLMVHFAVSDEPAAPSILKYADTYATDLIAMSTHGRTGLRRWVYGSVTEKILRTTHCSMLVVRPAAVSLN